MRPLRHDNAPLIVKLPLPSSAPPFIALAEPVMLTFAALLALSDPATSVAPSSDVPDSVDPSPRVNVPADKDTLPGAVPANEPVAAGPPPVNCRVPAVAVTAPPLVNA